MLVFGLIAVGYLIGRWVATLLRRHHAERRARYTAVLGGIAAGAATGLAVWQLTPEITADQAVRLALQVLRPSLGDAAPYAVAVLVAATMAAILYGICITAAIIALTVAGILVVLLTPNSTILAAVLDEKPDEPADHSGHAEAGCSAWRAAARAYGQAVASHITTTRSRPVRLTVCETGPCHLHLTGEGIAADWDGIDGWSAMTLRGRHWYPTTLVPEPGAIAEWLCEVGSTPRLGIGNPPSWRSPDEYTPGRTDADVVDRLVIAATTPHPVTDDAIPQQRDPTDH